ncbi:DUF4913 domain-containing protein [Streptomyces sp. NPDC127108]|uniref:DUF4913 domain-containing protein n=1 Tax=Streptomyces sp. NPDC127108 TaxID=3345361 RepID=UPI00362A8D4A
MTTYEPDPGETAYDSDADDGETTDRARLIEEEHRAGLVFGSLADFVAYLTQIVRPRLDDGDHIWCPRWWAHPEALLRLSAMWRAFEYLRHDASLGMSNWWLHHADPHLARLLSPSGPFHACAGGQHTDPPPLATEPVPPDVLDHPAFALLPEDPFAM